MKFCLFLGTRLDGDNERGESRSQLFAKYLNFYEAIQEQLGIAQIVVVLNGCVVTKKSPFFRFVAYSDLLPRGLGYHYPYGWRMLYTARMFLHEYDKIIFLDVDGFILTKRLANWVRDLNTGWQALWCPKYKFPDANLMVLCKDSFDDFRHFTRGDYTDHLGLCMEKTLPFTHIERSFNADRYGEWRAPSEGVDFYAQCPLDMEMRFRG